MNKIQFVLGEPGTGKTTYVLREICEAVEADSRAPLYYLVPEQFSLQSERLLLSFGREGATRVQVLSFNRLAHRLFSVLGGLPGKYADDLGKQMLLRRVLFEVADELEFYKSAVDKHGFIAELGRTITEMNHYCVGAADLRDRAADSSPALAAKLRDIAVILQKYREAVAGRYLLTDDMPEILCQKLAAVPLGENLPLLDGSFFWVDGFSGFTPQERQVLLHIFKRAAKITFTLTLLCGMGHKDEISPVPRETIEKVEAVAGSARAEILPHIYMKENFRHRRNERSPHAKGLATPEIIASADKYGAVYAAAHRVLRLVHEKNYRFRDIAILCGDRAQYEKILQTVFDREKIPIFVDTEIDILSHPLTELVRAVTDIFVKNWSIESVFRFLKTRLAGIAPDTVDILENYALANGIKSYRWKYEFFDAAAEEGRQMLIGALSVRQGDQKSEATHSLEVGFPPYDTVKNYSKRVFEILYALRVPDTLQSWFDAHMQAGDPETARIHAQVWPKLCEVFDKLVEILGDERLSLKAFAETLDAGLLQVGLGRIPPTLDQVVLGDISRSRYPQIRAMIVLGANDGVLMPAPSQVGLFTDHERKLLNNSGIETGLEGMRNSISYASGFEIAPENARRISEQNYNLHCALAQPSEKLIFIYAEGENGKPLRPAPILAKIRTMFPGLETTPAPVPVEDAAENSTFFAPVTLAAPPCGSTIFTAATRLEAFARCPFAYYMDYILRARPRKYYEVQPTDLGKLFHEVIANFTKRGNFDGSREEISATIDTLVDALDLENSIFYSTARNKYILDKVRQVAAASCHALCRQIKTGQYRPEMTEQEILHNIELGEGRKLALSGRIDRVDFSAANQIQIIDYKSGAAKFSADEALKGVQLQLVLYMNALLKQHKNTTPGGIFYFPVGNPIIDANETLSDADREDALFKAFKMSGMEASADPAAFANFAHKVEEKVKELGTRMANGDISARPARFSNKKSPCEYCKFDGVCHLGEGLISEEGH
ncbi:MAG: PD-(D/E)XK nuclease family protein [Defluviitaleaceae bacterium]|nr:PD-(D/E)XK nuclease family protein [Defluviitaleaceae bacterium]